MRLSALKIQAEVLVEGKGHSPVWTSKREVECKTCGSAGFISLKPIKYPDDEDKSFYHGLIFDAVCDPPKNRVNQLLNDLTRELDSYYDI